MLKRLVVLVSMLFVISFVVAQSGGTIKGKMIDKANGEPLPFANVVLMKGGSQVTGTMTDFDGKFTFTALTPGKYNIQATYVGYQAIKVNDVVVNAGQITFVPDIKASSGSENLDEFVVIEYEVPLISKDQTSSGGTVTSEDIKKMPGRSAASIAATVGGVYSSDDGSTDLNVRGARSDGTDVYIDGIKVRGSQNLPKSAIEQVSVITGGMPAQYGDATGGVVNITTKGASKDWFGGMEYVTSGFKSGDKVIGLDKFGYNLLGLNVSGPILTKKDSAGNKKDAIAGFFLSGEFNHRVDPRPYITGNWKLKDDVMAELNENPYTQNLEIGGVINNASYLRETDMEKTPFRLNMARKDFNVAGKIDLSTSKTTTVTIGGSFVYSDYKNYVRSSSLLNFQNNPQSIDRTWRAYARFTQRFANSTDEENPSLVKDAFVSFQVDYTNVNNTTQDEKHKDNFSHYGYIGKFSSVRQTTYNFETFSPLLNGVELDTSIFGSLSNIQTIEYNFEPGDLNEILANYTSNYYDAYAGDPVGHWDGIDNMVTGGGLSNGRTPINVYGLWNSMGAPYNGYDHLEQSQLRVSAQGSAGIKDHAFQIGFEYEQSIDSRYNLLSPAGLWNLGRQLTNTQIAERNFELGTYEEEYLFTSQTGAVYQYTFEQA